MHELNLSDGPVKEILMPMNYTDDLLPRENEARQEYCDRRRRDEKRRKKDLTPVEHLLEAARQATDWAMEEKSLLGGNREDSQRAVEWARAAESFAKGAAALMRAMRKGPNDAVGV